MLEDPQVAQRAGVAGSLDHQVLQMGVAGCGHNEPVNLGMILVILSPPVMTYMGSSLVKLAPPCLVHFGAIPLHLVHVCLV